MSKISIGIESKHELYALKEFIEFCIKKIENKQLEHEHFSDFLMSYYQCKSKSDVIIVFLEKYK